jgi:4-amino-4-deoxy-L-arabinose transferase-like glycosyltransferase
MAKNINRGNLVIAILLACLTLVIFTSTSPTIGLIWDEPEYTSAANSYAAWFDVLITNPSQALKSETIDQYWTINHQHPPLEKMWSGLIAKAARHFLDELTANRFGIMLMVSFLTAMLYLMMAETYGKAAGFFAVASLMSMPRFFFHAHVTALDVPVAAISFALLFIFWKTVDRKGWSWGILCGVVCGLVLATKLNGIFIPIALALWCLFFRKKLSIAFRFLQMGVTAVFVFLLIWPWLYHQTWPRLIEYANFHLHHFVIGQWYLGKFYVILPWHFTLVILWGVVPLSIMALFVAGVISAGKGEHDRGLAWLFIICILVYILPFISGKSMLYDNERLLMPVFPFIAALAGIGFDRLIKSLGTFLNRIKQPAMILTASFFLGIALLIPQTIDMVKLYPHLLSYYSEGVGGLQGANRLGLETTYWCETFGAALPYINSHAQTGDSIWIDPSSADVLKYYQTIGYLRRDLLIMAPRPKQNIFNTGLSHSISVNKLEADWYILQCSQSQYVRNAADEYPLLQILGTTKPVYQITFQDIPLMKVYGALKLNKTVPPLFPSLKLK